MNLRLLATPLVAATLLLSTSSCSKNDDPAVTPTPTPPTPAPVTNTASYKRDGVTITGTCRAYKSSYKDLSGNTIDVLSIGITEGLPAHSSRTLSIQYHNSNLYEIRYKDELSNITTYQSSRSVATVKDASLGSFSGTFSGTATTLFGEQSVLSDGVFSNARF
jgi:hypothetical protein